ncbi:unnamed protein product [Musa acuminata subsp. burmannicoides]
MSRIQLWLLLLLVLLSCIADSVSTMNQQKDRSIKSAVFLSPPFFLHPGSVANKFYFNIPFPKGHIALKSFDAEVIDENGIPVPLHETYLHHWVIERYYGRKESLADGNSELKAFNHSNFIWMRNAGICKGTLGQYYGLGSETRRTSTWVPDPYGIEVGNPEKIPDGYKEKWLLNVHAIDTRGVEDRLGCTECKCSLYNVTTDEFGRALPKDYDGGLHCCYDQTQCQVRAGIQNVSRILYLKYTVKWLNWVENIIPVKIYIFDVTDSGEHSVDPSKENPSNQSCKVEYEIKSCKDNGGCVDTKRTQLVIPTGGDIVYGVAHQHSAGLGATLYGQDGRVLCTSNPTYGDGEEAGNEAGYIVGMSTCYPKPGSVQVVDGEMLTLESNYSSNQAHTGVMGLFYVLVAEAVPKSKTMLFLSLPGSLDLGLTKHTWSFVLAGGMLTAIFGISYLCKRGRRKPYQPLVLT